MKASYYRKPRRASGPVASQSDLVSATFAPTANGSATAALTYTARTAGAFGIAARSVTFSAYYSTVGAASAVTASPESVADTGLAASTITITLVDATGQPLVGVPAAQIVVAVSGTGNTVTQPAAATNAAGQTTASFVSTTAAAKTITVTACGALLADTATVTVTGAEPSEGDGEHFFQSDWRTATGNSLAAVMDGTKWDSVYAGQYADVLEVVSAASVGFNTGTLAGYTGNVLRIRQRGTLASKPRITNVPESTTHWLRWYFRNDETANSHSHPVCYSAGSFDGAIIIVPWAREGNAAGMSLQLPYGGAYPYNRWKIGTSGVFEPIRLTNGVVYRYECQVQFLTANTIRLYPRVYNAAGTLLYDASNFFITDFPFDVSLQEWYDGGNSATLPSTAPTQIFSIGNEGPGGSSDNDESWSFAKLALSLTGWIGA